MPDASKQELSARSSRKRSAIVEAAWQVFSEQGFERTSMDAIIAICGGSKATLYHYFKSKEDLLAEAVLTRGMVLTEKAYDVLEEGRDFIETLHLFGERYLDLYLNSDLLEVMRLAVAEGKSLKIGAVVYKEGFKKNWGKMAKYLESHIEPARLFSGGGWTAAMQLKGLLDGEAVIRRSWGIVAGVSKKEIRTLADHAIAAFMRIYCSA